MKITEVLKDGAEDWGRTPMEYLELEKATLRRKDRARAQIAKLKQEIDERLVVPPPRTEVFQTSSGITAYRARVVDPTATGLVSADTVGHMSVSLPYISIQHGRER